MGKLSWQKEIRRTIRFGLPEQFCISFMRSKVLIRRIIAVQTTRRLQFVSLRSGSDMSYIPVAIDERPQTASPQSLNAKPMGAPVLLLREIRVPFG